MKNHFIFAATLSVLLLAGGASTNAAETTGPNYFNVRTFGALGDGTNLDSPAINRAIDAAAEAGGGTVLASGNEAPDHSDWRCRVR